MKQEFIQVGRIVNAHGIRGEVRVQPRRVSPALLTRCKTFYIDGFFQSNDNSAKLCA